MSAGCGQVTRNPRHATDNAADDVDLAKHGGREPAEDLSRPQALCDLLCTKSLGAHELDGLLETKRAMSELDPLLLRQVLDRHGKEEMIGRALGYGWVAS